MLEIFTHLAHWLTYDLMRLSPETKLGTSIHFFIEYTTLAFCMSTVAVDGKVVHSGSIPEHDKIAGWLASQPDSLNSLLKKKRTVLSDRNKVSDRVHRKEDVWKYC